MNINRVHESKERELLFTISLGAHQCIVGENAIINAFGGSTSFIDILPFVSIAGDRGQETKIVGEADIDDFAIRRLIAICVVRAVMNLSGDKRTTILDSKPHGVVAPIDHIISVGANRRAAPG